MDVKIGIEIDNMVAKGFEPNMFCMLNITKTVTEQWFDDVHQLSDSMTLY